MIPLPNKKHKVAKHVLIRRAAAREALQAIAGAARTQPRICFSIAWFTSIKEAERVGELVREAGFVYNGGYFHGMLCGRDSGWDMDGLYSVTY